MSAPEKGLRETVISFMVGGFVGGVTVAAIREVIRWLAGR